MAGNTMGNRIRDLRKRQGLTQDALAQLMFIPKSTISAYENDVIDIKSSVIIELANVLNTRPGYFYEDEGVEDSDLEELVLIYKRIKGEKIRRVALEQVKILYELGDT
jgi:transcriptional regulator with XRE-family HTH domain